jgi:hypothetical protein
MAYTTIKKPSDYFNTKLYTGTGSGNQSVTGVGFQPDWVWTKNRVQYGHNIYDTVRGVGKYISSNSSAAEQTSASSMVSFDSDGFTVGTGDNVQYESANGVSWNWKANGTGVANTDGSISSTVSANTTSGFSIVKYTGTGANATVGHGLGTVPKMIIAKRLTDVESWGVYHVSNGASKYMKFDDNQTAETATTVWNNTTPTSSVFSLGASGLCNGSSKDMIAYCFAEKKGFSKFGSYTGNGNADGTFVYTGFKPAFVIYKNTDTTGYYWKLIDNKTNTGNGNEGAYTHPNTTDYVNSSSLYDDFYSNGFKIRNTNVTGNGSGLSYIYMAFAEEPLVGDNPCTAR